ncbi:MAG: amino acid permease [Planctomycetota bacterium]
MVISESRPRNLGWLHAGPLLYGDWGTSRLYVLGLAFLYTGHASVIYLAAIGALMIAVSWAYTHICRCFPDGGGVYSAARQLSPTLSVVGATLLLSGYIMTAAISVIEAFHYFGVPHGLTLPLGVITIVGIGVVNWLGSRRAGQFALVIAVMAMVVSAVLAVLAIPLVVDGLGTISLDYFTEVGPFDAWVSFAKICLALAGLEAVANMTGIMKKPVAKTSRKTIWPVSLEVVVLNMVFGIALAGLSTNIATTSPDDLTYGQQLAMSQRAIEVAVDEGSIEPADAQRIEEVRAYRDTAMKVVAAESGERWTGSETVSLVFSKVAGITFGLLLLSATNTAVMAMVSVLFAMAQDRELPRSLTRLNYSGVPWIGLIVSVIVPIGVILVEQDVQVLAKLYVLGVCGAITTNILCCAVNRKLELGRGVRIGMWIMGSVLGAVSLTIAATQLESLAFSGGLVALVLGLRQIMQWQRKGGPEPIPEPIRGWLSEVKREPIALDANRPRIMLAARGRYQAEFACDLAKSRDAVLFVLFVRVFRVGEFGPLRTPNIEEDYEAQQALGSTIVLARELGVTCMPIYVTSTEIAPEILDYTVTYGCDTLIMGKSRRSVFSRKIEGDVITRVAEHLPDNVSLITRSADTPHVARRPKPEPEPGAASEAGAADDTGAPPAPGRDADDTPA